MPEYFYKTGRCVPNLSANEVGEELTRIHRKHGELAPSLVVKESKPKQAPLHGAFEWNDQVAAEEFRIHQARQIINVVTVKHEDQPGTLPVQAFVNITVINEDDETESRKYLPVKTVIETPNLYHQHLAHLKNRLKNMKTELSKFIELKPVCNAIDSID